MSRRRIIFDVDEKLYLELKDLVEHGQLKVIFTSLAKDLVRILKKPDGQLIVGALQSGIVGIGYNNLENKDGGHRESGSEHQRHEHGTASADADRPASRQT